MAIDLTELLAKRIGRLPKALSARLFNLSPLHFSLILCLGIFMASAKAGTKAAGGSLDAATGLQPSADLLKYSKAKAADDWVWIMTWNVQNLFDSKDDPKTEDETFLPKGLKGSLHHKKNCAELKAFSWRQSCLLLDWNEKVVRLKVKRVAAVIAAAVKGKGPDLIALQEVETPELLKELAAELAARGLIYDAQILIEDRDPRGIDLGILSRLKVRGKPSLIATSEPRGQFSRGFLAVRFALPDGAELEVINVHFPSPASPFSAREKLWRRLVAMSDPSVLQIALGDFNTTYLERQREEVDKRFSPWVSADSYGCKYCPGTHYYRPQKTWSFLDMILVGPKLLPPRPLSPGFLPKEGKGRKTSGGWHLVLESTQLVAAKRFQLYKDGTPAQFAPGRDSETVGVSDHLPLLTAIAKGDGLGR